MITNEKFKWISGTLRPNGDIRWSHGYTTRSDDPPCARCKVTVDDWVGQKATTRKTLKPSAHGEHNYVYKLGDKICSRGTISKVQCFTHKGNTLKHTSGKVWGWLEPDGMINWSHGWTSKLDVDPCDLKDHSGEYMGRVNEFGIPIGGQ